MNTWKHLELPMMIFISKEGVMMAVELVNSIYAFRNDKSRIRYMRITDVAINLDIEEVDVIALAKSAEALYKLSRITLIRMDRLEDFMKHMRKVPGTLKMVQKEYVRIGEGSIIYSIGRHRFIEMARAAGAVYKINEGTGGTVLVSLELFDKYMEQFREEEVEMKNPLWKPEEVE